MTTDEQRKERDRERFKLKYHNDPAFRERHLVRMREYLKTHKYAKPYKTPSPERLKQKAAAQDRYRKKMKALGLYINQRGDRSLQTRRWIAKPGNRAKKSAHMAVYFAVKKGKLSKRPCESCGAEATVAHHDDYSKPLDVRWLCPQHHFEIHCKPASIKVRTLH